MAASDEADVVDVDGSLLVAIVHVAGPVEREPDASKRGYCFVQRCLRCDELLAVWKNREAEPTKRISLPSGALIAVDPYEGAAKKRERIPELRAGDDSCRPVPIALA